MPTLTASQKAAVQQFMGMTGTSDRSAQRVRNGWLKAVAQEVTRD
jgi:hypothetical protein